MDHFPIDDPYDNESQETAPEKSCDNRKLKGHLQDKDSESLLVSNLGKSRQPTLVGGSRSSCGLGLGVEQKQDQRWRLWHRRSSDATLSKDGCASLFVVVVFSFCQI